MKISILTLFPEYFESLIRTSILGRAQKQGQVHFELVNIRDFATDKHKVTDDRPFGGGAGMVMMIEPIARALDAVHPHWPSPTSRRLLTSARGELFTQATAREYSSLEELVIICGHYEGVDERVATHLVDAQVRIGDYVLTGGEPAAAVIADAVTRLIPGVLGNEASLQDESHDTPGKLGVPQFTRPREFRGWTVPDVLLGGDHAEIAAWREAARTVTFAPSRKK